MTRQSCEFQLRAAIISIRVPPATRPRPGEARRRGDPPYTEPTVGGACQASSRQCRRSEESPRRVKPLRAHDAPASGLTQSVPSVRSPRRLVPRLRAFRTLGQRSRARATACAAGPTRPTGARVYGAGSPGRGGGAPGRGPLVPAARPPPVFSPPVLPKRAAGFSVRGARGCTCRSLAGRGTSHRHASSEHLTS